MKTSENVNKAFLHCVNFADTPEVIEMLDEEVVECVYIAWDSFAVNDGEEHPDIAEILKAGAELEAEGLRRGLEVITAPTDGNGVWTFLTKGEDHLVQELLRVAMILEENSELQLPKVAREMWA
jgi:hypothetical protein